MSLPDKANSYFLSQQFHQLHDHNWSDGKYLSNNTLPDKGLSVARMAAHITYLSKKGLQEKFGRKLQERDALKFGFDADFSNRELSKISRIGFCRSI